MPTGVYTRKPFSQEHRRKIAETRSLRIKEGKIKIKTLFEKGHTRGTIGKRFSEEHKRKISEAQKGEKCVLWRGGHKNYRVRSRAWNKLRDKIYARDGHTCQRCKATGVKLACHHIVPYRISHSDAEENLVTVCIRCHAILDFDILRTEKVCYGK